MNFTKIIGLLGETETHNVSQPKQAMRVRKPKGKVS